MVEILSDPRRTLPSYALDERRMLEAWLDYHRTTLLLKCEGLDEHARKVRPLAASNLLLHGLVRHMADVERTWFRRTLLDEEDAPPIFRDPVVEDREFVPLDEASWKDDLDAWQQECAASRAAAATRALDDAGVRRGEPCSLRWIYLHMINEYARHNGHADLLREMVDGRVGM
jgi:uncharacterized damage-inducible protein DinB